MPKGAKKRAKLKKKQQQGHPDDGANANANANASNGHGNGSDDTHNASSRGDGEHHLRIPPKPSRAEASEDSMESSEEMVTPRAAVSEEADEEERKAAAAEVPVERAAEADGAGAGEAAEEVMVDALPPEAAVQDREGKADAEVEVHAVVAQEPEVKDVVVAEAPTVQVQEPEVKREVAKVHPVPEPEPKADEVVVVEAAPAAPAVQQQEVKDDNVVETVSAPEDGNVVVKDSAEVSRPREAVDVHATEAARGPAVAVAAAGQRATWWNCCGLCDVFTSSER